MDGNFRLQNGLTLLSRIWTTRSKSQKAHKDDFSKSLVIFRKTHFFRIAKKKKIRLLGHFDLLVLFRLVDYSI